MITDLLTYFYDAQGMPLSRAEIIALAVFLTGAVFGLLRGLGALREDGS